MFHMGISSDKIFLVDANILTLKFVLFENVNLVNNFLAMSARFFIFHINNSCDKIFLLVLNLLTLSDDLYIFFFKMTLVISSE